MNTEDYHGQETGNMTLFLSGDVMTGRGIDQVMPQSVNPHIYEHYSRNALDYVQIAEDKNGSIPEKVSYEYIWGDVLPVLDEIKPGVRIINLETAITISEDYDRNKGIHYRMHPKNAELFTIADITVCSLGNNHIMDWGKDGIQETLMTLHKMHILTTGAGNNNKTASEPAVFQKKTGRLLVFAYASLTSGVPERWMAEDNKAGVNIISESEPDCAEKVIHQIRSYKQDGDLVVVSIHWGENFGYDIPAEQQEFAHKLIDENAADILYGHSSHHPKSIEVYKKRPIIYGCGDLINDYEGVAGYEYYRDDLSIMYFPTLNSKGELKDLRLIPMQIRRFQLCKPSNEDSKWMEIRLNEIYHKYGLSILENPGGGWNLKWE
jgi:poly-gamma-glutamate capsule biosynthesis protein CapA/YwtB (metallophosphatase superfamily)